MIYYCTDDACGFSSNTSPVLYYPFCCTCEDADRDPTNVISQAEIDHEILSDESFDQQAD